MKWTESYLLAWMGIKEEKNQEMIALFNQVMQKLKEISFYLSMETLLKY